MANGLISAGVYGGPQEAIVEDPNATPLPQPSSTIPVEADEPTAAPTPADVAPVSDRNIAEEQNWMKELQDYAASKYDNENEREKFIERASRYTRNNIAVSRFANKQILSNDRDSLDKILYNYDQFQGRGPRNDYEANQINPAWPAMRQLALSHYPAMQKYIDGVFTHNSKVDVPETSERTARFNQAYGLVDKAARGDPSVDKWEVLKQVGDNLPLMDLSRRQTGILRHDLSALKSQKDIDNQMHRYMQVASGLLNEAHIASTNDKQMNQFQGALAYELKRFQRMRKDPQAPLDDNDVLSITARLIRDRSTHFWQSPDRDFMVPDGWFTEENRDQFFQQFHREATPEDIYTLYQTHKANNAR
jgi:hypothetical protein